MYARHCYDYDETRWSDDVANGVWAREANCDWGGRQAPID